MAKGYSGTFAFSYCLTFALIDVVGNPMVAFQRINYHTKINLLLFENEKFDPLLPCDVAFFWRVRAGLLEYDPFSALGRRYPSVGISRKFEPAIQWLLGHGGE